MNLTIHAHSNHLQMHLGSAGKYQYLKMDDAENNFAMTQSMKYLPPIRNYGDFVDAQLLQSRVVEYHQKEYYQKAFQNEKYQKVALSSGLLERVDYMFF